MNDHSSTSLHSGTNCMKTYWYGPVHDIHNLLLSGAVFRITGRFHGQLDNITLLKNHIEQN